MNPFLENIRIALKVFSTRKSRTILSALGIIIGTASVILIMSLGSSASAGITKSISDTGLSTVMVRPGRSLTDRTLFSEELAGDIGRSVDNVAVCLPVYRLSGSVTRGKENYPSVSIYGAEAELSELFTLKRDEGEFFTASDNARRRGVVVLGRDIADALFAGGGATGQTVRIKTGKTVRVFRVIGVLADQEDQMGFSFNTGVFVPAETLKVKLTKPDAPSLFAIRVIDEEKVLETTEEIEKYLLSVLGDESYFGVMSPASMAEMFDSVMATFTVTLAGVALISLLVGGIGVMNIMLVSVTERTREIGIRMAVGASPGVIRGQFLVEAVCLTGLGGVIGVLAGNLIAVVVLLILKWTLVLSPWASLLGFCFSVTVGLAFGYLPAVRASRLDPVTALNQE